MGTSDDTVDIPMFICSYVIRLLRHTIATKPSMANLHASLCLQVMIEYGCRGPAPALSFWPCLKLASNCFASDDRGTRLVHTIWPGLTVQAMTEGRQMEPGKLTIFCHKRFNSICSWPCLGLQVMTKGTKAAPAEGWEEKNPQ